MAQVYQVLGSSLVPIDARYEVKGTSVIFYSRGGTIGKNARNTQYTMGLEILLQRILTADAAILGVWVDSKEVQRLELRERQILGPAEMIDGPTDEAVARIHHLLTSRMAGVGRAPMARGPGNRTRRIRIELSGAFSEDSLVTLLNGGVRLEDSPSDTDTASSELLDADDLCFEGTPPESMNILREVLARSNKEQRHLKKVLLKGKTMGPCCICGTFLPDTLLVAAHIKKRSQCTTGEREDYSNVGALMCALGCDALFERGLIIVDRDGIIRKGSKLKSTLRIPKVEEVLDVQCAAYTEGNKNYFAWHQHYHAR
ncbi:HNH endonuclease [Deinococcus sp. QL22]|uniref:HNH endonuclease n=1 Tax=Deinococcus sp. QL22 TaxID=2939437 RepID=UPI00201792F8|nr:HNH endonuclease [Deinococcus sp. QL22]UQN06497.1 hypothetical protein M1R55_00845 [Deinococcus sp. QL22]